MTPRVSEVRKVLVSPGLLANIMQWRFLKWNVVSEISKVLLNEVFGELDGRSGIKNIIS